MIQKEHVTAGKCIFTVANDKHDHYTYMVVMVESDNRPPVWFVSMLVGSDNESAYAYLGKMDPRDGSLAATRASKMDETSTPFKVAAWALRLVWSGLNPPDGYSILQSNKCCRCGRRLTTPESIASGIGPECARMPSFV